jgi:putative membrane protein
MAPPPDVIASEAELKWSAVDSRRLAVIAAAPNRSTEMIMRKKSAVTGAIALAMFALAFAPAAHAHPARPAALDDPTIVAIFDAANTWDMETSSLAENKATTKDIRDLAAMFVRDHKNVRQQGRDLAKKLTVTPTPPKDFALAADHEQAMKTLNSANGKAFDRAYLEHEVAYHKAVIDAITNTLLPATQNAEVKALEVKVGPAFQAHMLAAQRLLDGLGH